MADSVMLPEEPKAVDELPNLDFLGADTTYLTHGMHSFPARFPPQIVAWAIETFLGRSNEYPPSGKPIVFDPMVGSGTTVVEALLRGFHGFGTDIDPLARLMTRVKSRPLPIKLLRSYAEELRAAVSADIFNYRGIDEAPPFDPVVLSASYSPLPLDACAKPNWDGLTHWFFPSVIDELALIRERIRRVEHEHIREFFEIVFSACIVTKGGSSLANAYDLAHSRAHKVVPEEVPDTLGRFLEELNRKTKTITAFTQAMQAREKMTGPVTAKVVGEDGRNTPLDCNSVDLIVTSPPYINALDYPRATKFALYWLRWTHKDYQQHTRRYIGTERIRKKDYEVWVDRSTSSAEANRHIARLREKHPKMAGVIYKFTVDMQGIIREMKRVLKPGCVAIVVVGDNYIRGDNVATHRILDEVAKQEGFHLIRRIPRVLDRDKRQLPTDRGVMNNGVADEWVLHWQKPIS